LISHTLATHERISLITTIFSDIIRSRWSKISIGDDAQNFIDVIDEVSTCTLSLPGDRSVDSHPNFYALSIRHWIVSNHRSAGGVCTFIQIFVAAWPCFRSHWRFPSLTTQLAMLYQGWVSDVWKGQYQDREVAVKVLRYTQTSDLEKIRKVGCPRLVTCISRLTMSCTEVLQGGCGMEVPPSSECAAAIGCDDDETRLVMVSEWMVNGNINEFVKANVGADRLELVCFLFRVLTLLVIDDGHMTVVAERGH
jgi:hypothetical protein